MVLPLTPKLMPFELPNTAVPLDMLVVPAEIPEIPVCAPPALAPLIVIALPFWLRVMLFPPARVSTPEDICDSAPAVFPERVALNRL